MMTDPYWHDPVVYMTISALLAAVSGLPSALHLVSPPFGQRLSIFLIILAALTGISAALISIITGSTGVYHLLLPLPFGPHTIRLDPLSAWFSLPILIVGCCSSLYSSSYFPAAQNLRTTRKITLFFGLLIGSLLGILISGSIGLFLVCWEIMAISAYFVVSTDDDREEVRNAGTLYLICTHIGTLTLFAMFSLLASTGGSFALPTTGTLNGGTGLASVMILLATAGFSFKSGAMPLHVWLPGAHANAPSHISALMSGVILKIGVYGLVRTLSFFHSMPLWWGVAIMVMGVISGVVGVAFALGQHDLKRLLAYHSIENIGIIYIGIGVGLIGVTNGSKLLILLGMGGALLHVINHAVFKALLFLGAGSIIHAIGTREIDRMGGLLRQMPHTGLSFLIGAVAICGLPPLNGFVSELLIYMGLFNGAILGIKGAGAVALAAPFLALIGGLAVACFVKVFGVVFLGVARSTQAKHAHESPLSMKMPMFILALICIVIGLLPPLLAPLLDSSVTAWYPNLKGAGMQLSATAPLAWVSLMGFAMLIAVLLFYRLSKRSGTDPTSETWGCGYLAPTSRIQYTSSSFAQMLVELFSGLLYPQTHQPKIQGPYPSESHYESHVPETVLEKLYIPFIEWTNEKFSSFRKLQHGNQHIYILYILITLVVLLIIPE